MSTPTASTAVSRPSGLANSTAVNSPKPSTVLALPSPRPAGSVPLPPNATSPQMPSASSSKPYQSPAPSSGLALPSGWHTTQPVQIDPALQSASAAASTPATTGASTSTTTSTTTSNPYPPAVATNFVQRYLPQQQLPPGGTSYTPQTYPYAQQAFSSPYVTSTATATTSPYSYYAQTGYPRTPQGYQGRLGTPTTANGSSMGTFQVTPGPSSATASPNPLDSSDPNELKDALGSAGVDIRAEQDALQRSHAYYQVQPGQLAPGADRSKRQAFVDTRIIAPTVRAIAARHNLKAVPEDSVNYAALALRARLLSLIGSAIEARDHRSSSTISRAPGMYSDGTTPMWSTIVRRDVQKQLMALERVEREEEARIRRERRERLENGFVAAPENADEDSATGKKRKRQKEMGPGVTARTMNEETRKRMMDDAASRAIGGTGKQKYGWMTAGAAAAATTPAKKLGTSSPSTPTAGSPAPNGTGGTPTSGTYTPTPAKPPPLSSSGGWARARFPTYGTTASITEQDEARTITKRDVDFAIEKERGHGGGRGSARGWT